MNRKKNPQSEVNSAATKSDIIMNRVLSVLLFTLVVLIAIFAVYNNNAVQVFFASTFGIVLLAVSAVLLGLAVFYRVKTVKAGKNEEMKVFSSSLYLYCAAVFFGIAWTYRIAFLTSLDLLIVSVIATAVCYFVYYMYPLPMFSYSVMSAIGLVAIRLITLYSEADHVLAVVARILTIVYGVIIAVVAFIAQKRDGKLFGKLTLGHDFKCWYTVVTAALLVITGVIALAAPALLGYMTIAYIGLYFVLVVIGTILMI